MDGGRQFLRYSVPGSLFLLTVLGIQAAFRIAWDQETAAALRDIGAAPALTLLGASIPLGLIIYQVYYASYSALRLGGRLATRDRGAEVLAHLTCAQRSHIATLTYTDIDARVATHKYVDLLTDGGLLARGMRWLLRQFPLRSLNLLYVVEWRRHPCPAGISACDCIPADTQDSVDRGEAYKGRWNRNWDALMVVVALLAGDTSTAEVKREYTSTSDIYHALGASRTAIWTATVSAILYNLLLHRQMLESRRLPSVVAAIFVLTLSAALGLVLHQTRLQTQKSFLSQLKRSLRAVLPPDGSPNCLFDPSLPNQQATLGEAS